jgi:hypothetical protein
MYCKNYLWYNNSVENKRIHIDDDPPKGFVKGRIPFWTRDLTLRQSERLTGRKRELTEKQKKRLSEHAKNTIVKWQKERRAAGLPLCNERSKEDCLKFFKKNPIFTRNNFVEGLKNKKSIWREASNCYKSLLKYFRAEHSIVNNMVLHHIDEETNKYWDLRLNETVIVITKSEHASIHKISGWNTVEAFKKMKTTISKKEWREKHCCKIICYETGEKYNGLKEITNSGFSCIKVWVCCNDNKKYNGDLNYRGRKKSGNYHWYFEGDVPQIKWWDYRRSFNDWKHYNKWTKNN